MARFLLGVLFYSVMLIGLWAYVAWKDVSWYGAYGDPIRLILLTGSMAVIAWFLRERVTGRIFSDGFFLALTDVPIFVFVGTVYLGTIRAWILMMAYTPPLTAILWWTLPVMVGMREAVPEFLKPFGIGFEEKVRS